MGLDKNSVIFGIGLGFIILALVFYGINSIFKSDDEPREISELDIISRALELGYVQRDEAVALNDLEVIERAGVLGMSFPGNEPAQESSPNPTAAPTPAPAANDSPIANINIEPNTSTTDIAAILYQSGVISDEDRFAAALRQTGLTVKPGTYLLPRMADHERLLDILLDRD